MKNLYLMVLNESKKNVDMKSSWIPRDSRIATTSTATATGIVAIVAMATAETAETATAEMIDMRGAG